MAQRSVPAPFLTKTYNLVEDRASDDVVSWNEGGSAFVVWKTAEFAKDLLPNYFKHNNFSSFVRQLNTYGFRKTVPDKWEFANENFKRGQMDLLVHIRCRKNAPMAAKNAATADLTSPANHDEDMGSSSTSSPDSKTPSSADTQASAQLADLSGENEKLKKDNEILSSELAQTKRQCDELIAFLTRRVKVAPEQISRIMNLGFDQDAGAVVEFTDGGGKSDCGNGGENENCVKLFGVMVKKKKRGCESNIEFSGPQKKEMKMSSGALMMMMSASPGEDNKVCN